MIYREQGSGAMLMVIILLLLSAALLNATRRQMESSLSLLSGERVYYQQFSQAISALNWGGHQRWSPHAGWVCKTDDSSGWRACLLQQQPSLLRADGGEDTVVLWQWVEQNAAGELSKVPHGWLDFCPLAEETLCQPDE